MSAIQDLQNLAGKIEELKDKLSDQEYKDLLELSHKYYDKEKQKEETRKPRKFVEFITIIPVCHYSTYGNCDWEDDSVGQFTGTDHFVNDGCEDFRVSCRLSLKQERKLKEVKDGFNSDIDHAIQMTETTYLQLKEKKHLIFEGSTLIYVSTRIAH